MHYRCPGSAHAAFGLVLLLVICSQPAERALYTETISTARRCKEMRFNHRTNVNVSATPLPQKRYSAGTTCYFGFGPLVATARTPPGSVSVLLPSHSLSENFESRLSILIAILSRTTAGAVLSCARFVLSAKYERAVTY
ncbi:hypothetical protein EVAR_2873_1 [Eumeta japonica]|uniref:Secreted protein n=1 Tax=Eumeta variegata TaxID=151549 RepID=A0A4C1T0P7_EUMVA|nr:hypothetical protein EVAR_2873_1 [Eumeta japonica]